MKLVVSSGVMFGRMVVLDLEPWGSDSWKGEKAKAARKRPSSDKSGGGRPESGRKSAILPSGTNLNYLITLKVRDQSSLII